MRNKSFLAVCGLVVVTTACSPAGPTPEATPAPEATTVTEAPTSTTTISEPPTTPTMAKPTAQKLVTTTTQLKPTTTTAAATPITAATVPITNQFYRKGFCHNSNNPADPPYFAGPGGERIIYSYHPGSGSGVGSVDCLGSGTCCFVDSSRSGGEPGIYRCYFPCSEVDTPGATTTTRLPTTTTTTVAPKYKIVDTVSHTAEGCHVWYRFDTTRTYEHRIFDSRTNPACTTIGGPRKTTPDAQPASTFVKGAYKVWVDWVGPGEIDCKDVPPYGDYGGNAALWWYDYTKACPGYDRWDNWQPPLA